MGEGGEGYFGATEVPKYFIKSGKYMIIQGEFRIQVHILVHHLSL
jgi:hypothetical protein